MLPIAERDYHQVLHHSLNLSAMRCLLHEGWEYNPEWISFGEVVNGKCMRIKISGEDLWRVMTA